MHRRNLGKSKISYISYIGQNVREVVNGLFVKNEIRLTTSVAPLAPSFTGPFVLNLKDLHHLNLSIIRSMLISRVLPVSDIPAIDMVPVLNIISSVPPHSVVEVDGVDITVATTV